MLPFIWMCHFLAEKKLLDYRDVQFMFNRGDYTEMNSFLGSCDWSVDNNDIDRTVCNFYNNVYEAIYRFIPLKTFAPSRYPKWFNTELIHMVQYKRTGSREDYLRFRELRAGCHELGSCLYS
ncbi:hypothetical protein HHI36_013518, partial [Cryptolaemus montrouzieri]